MKQEGQIADLIFLLDTSNVILSYYTYSKDLLFTQPESFLGKNFTDVFPGKESALFLCMTEEVNKTKRSVSFSNDLKLPDGIHYFVTECKPCLNKNEDIENILVLVKDITEQKKQERLFNDTREAKDKLLSIIAHDLRSPLSGIIGLTNLFLNDNNQSPQQNTHLVTMIDDSAKTALNLLEDLLSWGNAKNKAMYPNPQFTDVNDLVKQSIALMKNIANAKMLTLEMKNNDEIFANIDRNMMLTVVRNLLSNAIKFTERGGAIICTTGKTDTEFWIKITDTGTGMNEETISNLFLISSHNKRSGTENEKGSGLGLLICKEFVNKHNGNIEVSSNLGAGSTFKIIIPLQL